MERDCDAFYGNPRGPGGAVVNPKWYQANIVNIAPPFPMHMGSIKIMHFPVHTKCAAAFKQWMKAMLDNAGGDPGRLAVWGVDVFSGSFNYRAKRGSNALSMHSYGIAVDLDAPRNQFKSRSIHFAQFKQQVVSPFLDLGGEWGGNWKNSTDGMHFQFAHP
jgi:hypothetical protein